MSETVQVHRHNPKKVETVERVASLAQKYPVLAVTSLSKVRASQLMAVRKALRQHAEVYVVKNKLAIRGLQKAGIKNADQLLSHLTGQNALIFSTYDPFKLFLTLDKNKVYLPARAGDKAPDDIIVPAGNTSLPAGPVLSEFREAGIQTKIEGGSIWINKDSVAVKKGGEITPKLASLLAKLNIKPIRAGLAIALAYESGLIYAGDVVAIDLDEYRKSLVNAYASSRGLAIVIGYVTKETAPDILSRAYREALSLQVEAGFLDKETAPLILGRAEAEAAALEAKAREKGLQ
ncbi:MAG: 50S ribosomal protein L10 [Nitrososphaerota archaeon]|jgi:large subunit ribosomal protein L10|nr:50S ribosomal protein L10 [Nitrososphaerota archaeon]MDG6971739.1 50S ribosomal protein L10 [Nitrososphaerota archaeon]MDG6976551.1 50S ribosomal protein L10 [Nitrososphaerota archaeon]MDG6981890.1 50S ribosomal protein L10 [Nitrososphaerota archaeon]MDG7014388.1 50S ribosomal protein L10 [Nitrososphaerota archaeon]